MNFAVNNDFAGLIIVNNLTRNQIVEIHVIRDGISIVTHLREMGGLHYLFYIGCEGYADVVTLFKDGNKYFVESTEIYIVDSENFVPLSLMRFGWKKKEESLKSSLALALPFNSHCFFESPDRFITISGKTATLYYKSPLKIAPDTLISRLIQLGKDIGDLEIAEEFGEKDLSDKLQQGISDTIKQFFPYINGGMSK